MQGADMQEVWFIKLFTVFGKIVAGVLGAILALVLSGDIDKDGRIKINPSLESLRTTNPEMYADVISQLEGGTIYFWSVAEYFMTQLLQIFQETI